MTETKMIATLADKVRRMSASSCGITNNSMRFIRYFAHDLKMQDILHGGINFSDFEYLKNAQHMLVDNRCRGFTMGNDQVWFFGKPKESDKLHECIHVLSAAGGKNAVTRDLGLSFNEGITQYLTIRACEHLGVEVNPAYERLVDFVSDLEEKVGVRVLCQAYFLEDYDPLLGAMVQRWSKPSWSDKKEELKKKLRNIQYSEKWLRSKLGL